MPEDLAMLERDHRIWLVINPDTRGMPGPFMPWRVTWYVAGQDRAALQGFVEFLDYPIPARTPRAVSGLPEPRPERAGNVAP